MNQTKKFEKHIELDVYKSKSSALNKSNPNKSNYEREVDSQVSEHQANKINQQIFGSNKKEF